MNSATDALIIIGRKFPEHWTDTFDSCFNDPLMLRQLTSLNFKWIKFIKMMPSLKIVLSSPAEAHFGPSQAPKMGFLARIVDGVNLKLLTIFV